LIILQINIEGWIRAKREILEKLTSEHQQTVVMIQETHQENQEQERLKLGGYILADYIPSKHHGIATFVRNLIPFTISCK